MLRAVPFSPTLRQRLDMGGKTGWAKVIMDESANLLGVLQAEVTPCLRDLAPLDIDVAPFDNSGTKKEGVSRSYKTREQRRIIPCASSAGRAQKSTTLPCGKIILATLTFKPVIAVQKERKCLKKSLLRCKHF
ncbi:MAG: hypothetical protein AB1420_03265 [Bacillota bacterium]